MFRKTTGIVAFIAVLALSAFLLNCGSSNSRPSGVLFAISQGASVVESYAINLGNGDLSQLNTSATTCANPATAPCGFPVSIIFDPAKANIFVLNQGAPAALPPAPPSIYGYGVKSDGSLTGAGDVSTSLGIFTAGDIAVAMARDAAGKFLFVVTQGNQNVQPMIAPQLIVFGTQAGSTSLTAIGSPIPLTRVPTSVAVVSFNSSAGPKTLLYITSNKDLQAHNDNTLSEYLVDSSGTVTEQVNGGSPLTTGTSPSAVLPVFNNVSNNLFVYVTDNDPDDNIRAYQVCTIQSSICSSQDLDNNKIVPIGSPVPVGLAPLALITDPTSNFLYVANSRSSTVSSFRINPTTGALTALNPGTVSTGATPVALTIHPNGEFLYTANSGSGSGTGSVNGFSVNITSGSLSGGLQVNSSAQPAGLVAK